MFLWSCSWAQMHTHAYIIAWWLLGSKTKCQLFSSENIMVSFKKTQFCEMKQFIFQFYCATNQTLYQTVYFL